MPNKGLILADILVDSGGETTCAGMVAVTVGVAIAAILRHKRVTRDEPSHIGPKQR